MRLGSCLCRRLRDVKGWCPVHHYVLVWDGSNNVGQVVGAEGVVLTCGVDQEGRFVCPATAREQLADDVRRRLYQVISGVGLNPLETLDTEVKKWLMISESGGSTPSCSE